VAAGCFVVSLVVAPRRGLLARWWVRRPLLPTADRQQLERR
jgi:hypothetical protein